MSEPICPPGGNGQNDGIDSPTVEEDDSCNLSLLVCSPESSLNSSKCSSSVIAYLIDAACSACLSLDSSWESYASENDCSGLPQLVPSPLPSAFSAPAGTFPLPSLALAMASATPTPTNFDFAAAQAFAIAAGEQVTQQTSSTATSSASPSSTRRISTISGPGSQSVSTSASQSATTPISTSSLTSSQKKTPPAGDIVGIVIAICAVILLAGLSLVRFRRRGRRRQHHADVPSSPVDSASHIHAFDTSVTIPHSEISDSRSISKVRRQFLQNELRATQEKMIHIRPDVQSQGPTPGITRVLSAREGSISVTTESANSEAMSQLRERNEALSARIRELEAQMESPWALGLSDEPPPGYSEEEQQ